MARSDLLLSLVRAGIAGDKALLRVTVEALVADERAKKHIVLADKLSRMVEINGHQGNGNGVFSESSSPGRDFIAEVNPLRKLSELVLTKVVREQVSNLIEEQHRADLLRSHGLQPRHRVLLSGPPGNGKTALAEALAEAVAVPFFVVRYDALIGSFLGETTHRLRKLFDYVRSTPCVLLFDEFDAIGKERGDIHETGEIKRVVSSLLLQMDALPSYVVVVVATNRDELLDRAVWRRFQLRLNMPAPTPTQLVRFLACAFASMPSGKSIDTLSVGNSLWPVSYAEATEFLIDVRRRHVLSFEQKRFVDIITEQIPLWSARGKVQPNGERPQKADTQIRSGGAHQKNEGDTANPAVTPSLHAGAPEATPRPKTRRSGASSRKQRQSTGATK